MALLVLPYTSLICLLFMRFLGLFYSSANVQNDMIYCAEEKCSLLAVHSEQ